MRIHWPRLARLRLPGSVCLSVHLLVRLQLSVLLYGGRSTYQCVSQRLGETAHSALDKAKSRLQTHPVYTLSICAMLVCMSALCLLLMEPYPRPRGTGDREEKGRAKLNSDTRWGKALQYECINIYDEN